MTTPRTALTSDDILPGPLSEDDLRRKWNEQADEHNQWESLDSCEQLAWAQARAIAADRARTALKAEPEGEGPRPCGDWFTVAMIAQDLRSRGLAEQVAGEELLKLANGKRPQTNRSAPAPKPIPVSERLPEDADCLVIPSLDKSTYCRFCWRAREIMHCGQARLIWDWGLVPLTTAENWPFTYWLPASTQLLPTTVDSDQST